MSRCLQSSFTVSIHLFLGVPCLLVPCTYLWSASFGYLVWSILCTWPKYCIRHCCMRFATSWSRPTLSHTSLFLILSLRVTPAILLKQDISNTSNLFSCVCFKVQVSELYIVSYTFNFVVLLMSIDHHTFFNIWNTVLARVYFRPLKKGVVLPLAIVKRGRATPWTYKKGVATPWTCNQSLIKPNGFYSIRPSHWYD